jgi:hypothetical protein
LNNENIVVKLVIEDKIAVIRKFPLLRTPENCGFTERELSYLNSACSKVLVPLKIFQFQDMGNGSERYQNAANGLVIYACE